MVAAVVAMAVEQGATYRSTILWQTGVPPAAVDITGYTARMMLKPSPVASASTIVNISQATVGVVTTRAAHKLVTGQSVVLPNVGGMVELNTRYEATVLTATTFSIGVDTTLFTPYTSGGVVAFLYITDVLGVDGQLVVGTTGGDIQIYIRDSVTDAMSGGGTYDLEMISPAPLSDVTRLVQGAFTVNPNTTK